MNKDQGSQKLASKQLRNKLVTFFRTQKGKPFNAGQLKRKLSLANNTDSISDALSKLVDKELIEPMSGNRYRASLKLMAKKRDTPLELTGTVDLTRRGDAYIICDESNEDVFVPKRKLYGALGGDRVKVMIIRRKRGGKPEGKVTAILKRSITDVLVHIFEIKHDAIAFPVDQHGIGEVRVEAKNLNGAIEGDIAVAKIIKWPARQNDPWIGTIIRVVTNKTRHELESLDILFSQGFTPFFSEEIEEELKSISIPWTEEEIKTRRDFRDVPTATIDPSDAKDFDDALSFRYLENGHREVGIHIADVSYFLRPGSKTDEEAFKRSTSVYLVGMVAPMLPEILSNELCSLKPNEDRLTFSAVFTFDKEDRIVDKWFGRGIIHSDKRFTYEEAQDVIDTGEGPLFQEIKQLNRISRKLRKSRFKTGSINFQTREAKFTLDEQGFPIAIEAKEHQESHQLVEELMLLANREVALFIQDAEEGRTIPFVYRIHDLPDKSKLADFALLAKELGFPFDLQSPARIAKSFNRLMQEAREREELKLLEPLAIRTMSKAEYSTKNIGHYGLGFEYYTHFTSPIRRYSDVLVHRILDSELTGKGRETIMRELEEKCNYISRRERSAMTAERDSIKLKQAQFLEDKIGREFRGVVNGMIERGLFIELGDTMAEGMLPFSQFEEPFMLADNGFTAMGKYSGLTIRMGSHLMVRLVGVDLERRQVDLELVELISN